MGPSWVSEFARFYQEGGGVMHVILLGALFSGGLGLVAAIVRTRLLGLLALGLGLGLLGLGALGWWSAVQEVEAAVATVSADQRAQVREVGMGLAAIPLQFAGACAAPGLLGGLLGLVFARRR